MVRSECSIPVLFYFQFAEWKCGRVISSLQYYILANTMLIGNSGSVSNETD